MVEVKIVVIGKEMEEVVVKMEDLKWWWFLEENKKEGDGEMV